MKIPIIRSKISETEVINVRKTRKLNFINENGALTILKQEIYSDTQKNYIGRKNDRWMHTNYLDMGPWTSIT